jgi:dTDP-4-amino-4,6-dideoxygalactose transaminase
MHVPFLDLAAQYNQIKPEILKTINDVLESQDFIQGKFAQSFAKNFLEVHGGKYGVGCSNGTSAITVALRALGIGAGDEVISVTNTFFATVEAIAEVGAIPVLVDCNASDYLIDVQAIEEKIGPKTKAIMPVHLYGNACAMTQIMALAQKYNLKVIEDCAQGHLASYNGQAVGTFGDAGTFSFYPGKNLGAYGDAGFIICSSAALQEQVAMQVNHGRVKKYEHDFMAGNFRIDGLQAAVLDVKLKYLKAWTQKRQAWAHRYDDALKKAGFKVIEVNKAANCVYHLYVVEVANRDEVANHLKAKDIGHGIHYPIALHRQPAMKQYGLNPDMFPVAERTVHRILSLPIFPEMSQEQFDYTVEHFLKVARP